MIKKSLPKPWLIFYLICLALTWLEALINPSLLRLIVASFEDKHLDKLWQEILFALGGHLSGVLHHRLPVPGAGLFPQPPQV